LIQIFIFKLAVTLSKQVHETLDIQFSPIEYRMKQISFLLLASVAVAVPQGKAKCEPKNQPAALLGKSVPMIKEHIGKGCADLEILIGTLPRSAQRPP
jgi:hypothetical protein